MLGNAAVPDAITDLEKHLGVSAQRISLGSVWDEVPPTEANGKSLREYLADVLECCFSNTTVS